MKRRDFIKLSALLGASAGLKLAFRSQKARASSYDDGPIYLYIHANGGWDPTMLCDPKGKNDINRSYTEADILTAGNIRYAPTPGNQAFFSTYGRECLVLNGLDMATGSHTGGTRYAASGHLESGDYPAFVAAAAGVRAPTVPLSFISFGGYSVTGGLVPMARLQDNLGQMAQLTGADFVEADRTKPYYSDESRAAIDAALAARHDRALAEQHLPFVRFGMSQLEGARLSADELKRLDAFLPAELTGSRLDGQAQLALAACKAGICVGANLRYGSFDSHSNNDTQQASELPVILAGIDTAMKEAERLGLRERLVVIVGSEFGRTPKYNGGNGKDHHSVGSMLILGASIRGDRVVGATDDAQKALKIDPTTLELSTADSAIKLTPEHVHLALREHAGIGAAPELARFQIFAEKLALL